MFRNRNWAARQNPTGQSAKFRTPQVVILLVVGLALLSISSKQSLAAPAKKTSAKIQTKFVKDTALTAQEVSTVQQLAKASGIEHVAKIETFYYLPCGGKGILVTSVETVSGRKISFSTLIVSKDGWSDVRKAPKGAKQRGAFWINPPAKPEQRVLTTFPTPKGIIRVAVNPDVPLPIADKIVEAFTRGRVVMKTPFEEPRDWSHPEWIGTDKTNGSDKPHGNYIIRFSDSYDEFEFRLKNGGIEIVSVIHVSV